jgi:uncharacterized protein (TIGR02271 family)
MADQEQRTVVGVFDDYAAAQEAARQLETDGIPRNAISVDSNFRTSAAGYGGAEQVPAEDQETHHKNWFQRLFSTGEDEDRGTYQEALRRGSAIVAVTAPPDQVERVARVMNDLGAVDIDRRADYYRQTGYSGANASAPAYTADEAARDHENFRNRQGKTAVPVIEEELQVGKRAVQRGGVRIYSHVVNQPVEEQVNLREEHVRVERRPANRPVEAGDLARMRDQTIEVPETAEEVVISKRARVREEVVVGKETTERTETVRDNVRRTEVRVDPLNASGAEARTGNAPDLNAGRPNAAEPGAGPAYTYGSRVAGDPRFTGRSWDDAEDDVRVDYMRNNPSSRWEEVKADIRRGWEKVTGKR